MLRLFELQSWLMTAIALALLAIEAWAFIDALSRRPQAFAAAEKLNKPAWLAILGLALVANVLFGRPTHILNLMGAVAAIVYLVDARPALRALSRR